MADVDENSEKQLSNAAEAAQQRREIRRRKILNNQADRMKKLTGFEDKKECVDVCPDENGSAQYLSDIYDIQSKKAATDESTVTRRARTISWESHEDPNSLMDHHSSNVSRLPSTRTTHSQDRQMTEERTVTPARPGNELPPDFLRLAQDMMAGLQGEDLLGPQSRGETGLAQPDQSVINSVIRWRYILTLLLGVLVRFSFILSLGEQYVQSIFYPFVAFEICIVGYQKALGLDLGAGVGGIWLLVLQLCGVRRELIQSYRQTMGIASTAFEDFTSYLFSFIMTHVIVMLF